MANPSIFAAFERMWQHLVNKLGDQSTELRDYTDTRIADLVNSAPETLDTLGELAAAMEENADVVEALDAAISTKANASTLTEHANDKENPHGVALSQLGVTATAAELNIMDGVTATAAEINKLDGLTATTAELNYVDGVTSAIQTQLDTKVNISDLVAITDEEIDAICGTSNDVLTLTMKDGSTTTKQVISSI